MFCEKMDLILEKLIFENAFLDNEIFYPIENYNLFIDKKYKKVIYEVFLPYFKKEEINLKLKDNYIIITAKKEKQNTSSEEVEYLHKCCIFSNVNLKKALPIPKFADKKTAKSKFESGVLYIAFDYIDNSEEIKIE